MDYERMRYLKVAALIVAVLSISLSGLNNHDLWTPDEPRVAEIGREMALTGNWFVPMLNGRYFLEEPPLYYASIAFIFKLTGYVSDGLARVPSALYGMAGVFATFLIAYTLFGTKIGLISAFILATSFEYLRVSHWVVVDSALSCFIYFAMWAFLKGYLSNDKGDKWRYYMLLYLFSTLAFFVKGFIGIGVPAVAILVFLIFDRNLKEVLGMHLFAGILLFTISLGFWVWGLYSQGGLDYLKVFFIDNNLMRFLPGGKSGHQRPFYYYLTEFPAGFLPWSIFLLPAFYYIFSKGPTHNRRALLFLKCYFISGFILFSIASTKRILYLLPLFAPISIIIGYYVDYLIKSQKVKGLDRFFMGVYGIIYPLLGLFLLIAYFYLPKNYGLSVSKGTAIALFVICPIIIVVSTISLIRLKKGEREGFFILSGVALVAVLLFSLNYIAPELDRYKSLKPFAMKVGAYVPKDLPLYGYRPDETLRGFIPFYTGRFIREIKNPDEVLPLLKKGGRIYIVIRDKEDEIRKELENMGFSLVIEQPMGQERSLSLYRGGVDP
ncbi:MAG: glycosyltransferase family 39 protein [Syntrophorhabdaceae bacterium]|nr:glycosyltransferase family 39 protein [Syntrophorhabdaceae bacterium]